MKRKILISPLFPDLEDGEVSDRDSKADEGYHNVPVPAKVPPRRAGSATDG